jgi:hypothetical protein
MVLPEEGRRASVIRYYESIKNLRGCQTHPLFWLQYAIACLAIEDLDRAGRYFQTAYSLAKDQGWDTFQIDNHFARYLLSIAVDRLEAKEAMASFREARQIINRQIQSHSRHYPYRVAKAYQSFLDRFGLDLPPHAISEIQAAARAVYHQAIGFAPDASGQRSVKECIRAMNYVVERRDNILRKTRGDGSEDEGAQSANEQSS